MKKPAGIRMVAARRKAEARLRGFGGQSVAKEVMKAKPRLRTPSKVP